MKVLITGVSGFIGEYLASFFLDRSWEVTGTTSRTPNNNDTRAVKKYYNVKLGMPIPQEVLCDYDLVIHASYDQTHGNDRINYDGTMAWVKQLAVAGAKRQVLLSSCSSHPNAPSEYGRLKDSLEREFLSRGLDVLRLGLVIGNGGLFAQIRKVLLLPVTVALTGVNIRLIPVDLVGHALLSLIKSKPYKYPVSLFYSRSYTMTQLAYQLRSNAYGPDSRWTSFVLPIPAILVSWILNCVSPLSTQIRKFAISLNALRFSSRLEFQSDLTSLDLDLLDTSENMNAACSAMSFVRYYDQKS